jgi:hypothetical protein
MPHQQQILFNLDLGKTADSLLKSEEIQRLKPFEKKVLKGYPKQRARSN